MLGLATDLLTIPQAADALNVSASTIRRWIESGRLPGYRVGPKRLMVRRGDLQRCIRSEGSRQTTHGEQEPRSSELDEGNAGFRRPVTSPTLTEDEQKRGLKVLAKLRESLERQLAARGGVPYEDSAEQLHEIREERYGGNN